MEIVQCAFALWFLVSTFVLATTSAVNQTVTVSGNLNVSFVFSPQRMRGLVEDSVESVYFTVEENFSGTWMAKRKRAIQVQTTNSDIAVIEGPNIIDIASKSIHFDTDTSNYSFALKGVLLGRTQVAFFVGSAKEDTTENHRSVKSADEDEIPGNTTSFATLSYDWQELDVAYDVAVVRELRLIDKIFLLFASVVAVVYKVGMGCKTEIKVIKEVVRYPVPLIIGFVCQFTIMPTISFALSKAVGLEGGQALGFFAAGCAPGGGSSNMYTFMLRGDVSLSVTMTLVSVIASLGMIPLWMLTLGQYILDTSGGSRNDVHIPFMNIFLSLLTFIGPISVGMLIKEKLPRVSKVIVNLMRPLFVIFVIFLSSVGIYSNLYIFKLFTPQLVLAGMILPYAGFVLGGLFATICQQPRNRIITIAIETGIQNVSIPMLMLKYSLPQPEADLSLVSIVNIMILTPIPLWIAISILEVRRKCFANAPSGEDEEEVGKDDCFKYANKDEIDAEGVTVVFVQGSAPQDRKTSDKEIMIRESVI